MTQLELSSLKAGDVVRFDVQGLGSVYDKARFIINGTTFETTNIRVNQESKGLPGYWQQQTQSNEFYFDYTIPAGVTTFNVYAELHYNNQWY